MPMKNPPHPGHSIKDACLDPLGLSVTQAAKVLGIAQHTLSRVLNGHAGVSPDMAIRLERPGGRMPTTGFVCKPLTISPRPASISAISRCSATNHTPPHDVSKTVGLKHYRKSPQIA